MKKTFTKKFVKIIVAIALLDIQLSYILAFMGREQIAEDLGKVIVTEIIGVFFVYCVKAFFETKEEKNNELKIIELEKEITDDNADI